MCCCSGVCECERAFDHDARALTHGRTRTLQGAGARLSDMFVEEERRGGAGDGLLSLAQVVRIVREALRGNLSPADARCVVASAFRASALRDGRVSVNEFRDALLQPQVRACVCVCVCVFALCGSGSARATVMRTR